MKRDLTIVCDIIKGPDLDFSIKIMREIGISKKIKNEHNISLLKIKFDFIINGEKCRFLAMGIIVRKLTFTISGICGLALLLEAL